jgi:hypothetical protein
MLRDNPVGLIRADEAARGGSYSLSLSRCFLLLPGVKDKRQNIGRIDPRCLKMPARLPRAGEAASAVPENFCDRCGIGYLPCLHVPLSYPANKSLATVRQTSTDEQWRQIRERWAARYVEKTYVEECQALQDWLPWHPDAPRSPQSLLRLVANPIPTPLAHLLQTPLPRSRTSTALFRPLHPSRRHL